MAADYAAQNYNVPSNQLSFYHAQQQPSPADSMPPTPSNISPTSPRMDTYLKYQLPNQVRQLRPPKSPLYVPAVLRPTERPPRQSPMTPPKSLHGSLDSLQEESFDERMGAAPFDVATHGFIGEEELGDVTGPPKKDHWKVSNNTLYTTLQHINFRIFCIMFRLLAGVRASQITMHSGMRPFIPKYT